MTNPAFSAPVSPAPLDPSDTIANAFRTYTSNIGTLLPIALVLYAIPSLLALVLTGTGGTLLLLVLSVIASTLFTGIVVELVRDVEDGTLDSSVGDLISSVTPLLAPLIGLAILQGIAQTIGLAFFLAPGLFLLTIWAVTVPSLLLERLGVFASFSRSSYLVKGNGWQVFGVILAIFVLTVALRILVAAITLPLGDAVSAIITWLFAAAVAPIGAIVATVLYLRLRTARGEAPLPTGKASPKGPLGI